MMHKLMNIITNSPELLTVYVWIGLHPYMAIGIFLIIFLTIYGIAVNKIISSTPTININE